MDRRRFLQALLSSPLLVSSLRGSQAKKERGLLYLISDSPQDYLWIILQELRNYHRIEDKSFSFSGSSLCHKAIWESLTQRGWKYSPNNTKSGLVLSSSFLNHKAFPSFTFVKGGNILDIRSHKLASLWEDMRKRSASASLLTTASFNEKTAPLLKGSRVCFYLDGHRVDSLSLNKKAQKTYLTKNGHVSVKIESGKVRVIESSCAQKICCLSKPISSAGDRIICAPNRFLLEIERTSLVDTAIG